MKRNVALLFVFVVFPLCGLCRKSDSNLSKYVTLRAGMEYSCFESLIMGKSFGPTIGIAFEKRTDYKNGFSTEFLFGYGKGLNTKKGREIRNVFSLTIPLQWTCKLSEHFGIKTGSQAKIVVLSPNDIKTDEYVSENRKTSFLFDVQFPFALTYYADKRISVDFTVSIPILPVIDSNILACNTAFCVVLGWSLID